MKFRVQRRYCIISISSLILLALGIACGRKDTAGNIQIQVPWPKGNGSYEMQFVPVGFTNLRKMEGPAVVFFDEASLVERQQPGKSEIVGGGPYGKFISVGDNKFVAATYKTLFLSTVYAHIERLNKLLIDTGHTDVLSFPMKIGVNPKSSFAQGDMTNNAAYASKFDGIFIFPFDKPGLPLGFNAGVIAHEYFHAIYDHSFQQHVVRAMDDDSVKELNKISSHFSRPTMEVDDRRLDQSNPTGRDCGRVEEEIPLLYNLITLRAMNEGLADVWAWIYTDDTDFIVHSFGQSEARRKLLGKYLPLPTSKELHARYVTLLRDNECKSKNAMGLLANRVYYLGTDIARFVVAFAKAGKMSRPDLAKLIVDTVKKMPEVSFTPERKLNITFKSLIETFLAKAPSVSVEQCELVNRILAPAEQGQPGAGVLTCVAR